jgi:hypothetical protein
MERNVVRLGATVLVVALALPGITCRAEKTTGIHVDREGSFSITSTELGDTAISGKRATPPVGRAG